MFAEFPRDAAMMLIMPTDCDLGLHRLRQQRSRAVAQNLGQRVGKSSWLAELKIVSVGHGVSLLRWRSGGVKHPHDTPPYPFMPSPTFAHGPPSTCRESRMTPGDSALFFRLRPQPRRPPIRMKIALNYWWR